jgi:hypothetical protein
VLEDENGRPNEAACPYVELLLRPRLFEERIGHSVFTVANFASSAECDDLIAAGYRVLKSYSRSVQYPRERLPLATRLDHTLFLRLLSLLELHMPDFCESTFGQSSQLKDMGRRFSPGEPAVNIYTAGGEFAPHTDKEHVTMLSMLPRYKPTPILGSVAAHVYAAAEPRPLTICGRPAPVP